MVFLKKHFVKRLFTFIMLTCFHWVQRKQTAPRAIAIIEERKKGSKELAADIGLKIEPELPMGVA